MIGFEPMFPDVKDHCLTTWLHLLFFIMYNYMFFGIKNILIYINPNNIYNIILQYHSKNTLVPGDLI
jgi:hypothetical protein